MITKVKSGTTNQRRKLAYRRLPFIDIGGVDVATEDYTPKSIYDLKTRIKDTRAITTIKFLIKNLKSCDIDPEIYFMLDSAKTTSELVKELDKILHNMSSRKYDEDGKSLLCTIQFLLKRA